MHWLKDAELTAHIIRRDLLIVEFPENQLVRVTQTPQHNKLPIIKNPKIYIDPLRSVTQVLNPDSGRWYSTAHDS